MMMTIRTRSLLRRWRSSAGMLEFWIISGRDGMG
jgi:hypothetical protein